MLLKQNININFAKGLDTKTDPFQVQVGKFLSLTNAVFTEGGLLKKRDGFGNLTALPDNTSTYATTFNGNLVAVGTELNALSQSTNTWYTKANLQPLQLKTLPLIRSNATQSQIDTAIAPSGLICTVFTDNTPSASYKYVIADSVTGQNIVAPTLIPVTTGVVTGSPRVFILKSYFIIMFTNLSAGVYHLQYVAISINNVSSVTPNTDIAPSYTPSTTLNFDAFVAADTLFIAWNDTPAAAVSVISMNAYLALSSKVSFAGKTATLMSVTADITGVSPIVYVSFYDSVSQNGYTLAVNSALVTVLAPTLIIAAESVVNLTTSAQNGVCSIFYEIIDTTVDFFSPFRLNYIKTKTITQVGVVSSTIVLDRSVGLASKSFIVNGMIYMLSVYSTAYQPSYFLLDGTGQVVSMLAYSNAGGYYTVGLPSVDVSGEFASVGYLIKTQLIPVNKAQGAVNTAGVYAQVGLNLVTFDINNEILNSVETGNNLNFPGGFLLAYDGYSATENGFFLWPDIVKADNSSGVGGHLSSQQYYYVAIYEWTDNQGNIFRSAPSLPIGVLTGAGNTNTNVVFVDTLRLTYKKTNPVKIVIYRWSVAQQTYYQITSVTNPLYNDTTVDYVTFTDTFADATILGNSILYTTGGVIENIAAPPLVSTFLFDDRLFGISSEDRNLIVFSKQVIESTPVEMSDLLTIFVAPTLGAQGSTGVLNFGVPMDDKAILFKKDAIYYFNGTGPDNTGANNQYSQPLFITATVGSSNQRSLVMTPHGLMFQSDKGIWILKRDLSTEYIGAPVERFNDALVVAAINVPGTNQVRFTLDNGITLMYDYYYGEWGDFGGIPGISSTLYQGLHTFINQFGQVLQETPGKYLDGSNAVLMSFTTSWLNLTGLQGYQRAYFFYLLGVYKSPHKLNLQIAYDYNESPLQNTLLTPNNSTPNYGVSSPYGEGSYGGPGNVINRRVFLKKERCTAFQITANEIFDPSFGTIAGEGLTLSGINLVYASKKGWFPISNANSAGKS